MRFFKSLCSVLVAVATLIGFGSAGDTFVPSGDHLPQPPPIPPDPLIPIHGPIFPPPFVQPPAAQPVQHLDMAKLTRLVPILAVCRDNRIRPFSNVYMYLDR